MLWNSFDAFRTYGEWVIYRFVTDKPHAEPEPSQTSGLSMGR
jgi:hypothetical protein